jgi:hypothetical protein
MSMHLEGPWLSTTGKRKGKIKFKSAEDARLHRELEESWKNLQKKWKTESDNKKIQKGLESPKLTQSKNFYRRSTPKYESLNGGADMAIATKSPDKMYTGDKMLGITLLHKSCLQPVFTKQEAIDAANMRR